ncbi:MAG: hypothetical protein ABR542_08110, partial [Desulfonatronovibrio sp.]
RGVFMIRKSLSFLQRRSNWEIFNRLIDHAGFLLAGILEAYYINTSRARLHGHPANYTCRIFL